MHKTFLTLIIFQLLSLTVSAESLNLKVSTENKPSYRSDFQFNDAKPHTENDQETLRLENEDKSVLPVVLSVSFLLMSLYGDNPNSPMYRTVGAVATVTSFKWYF